MAISDPLGVTAQGMKTLQRRSRRKDLEAIREIVRDFEVKRIVVGLPRKMDGTVGTQAQKAEQFAAELREGLGLPVETWDERLTTVAAEKALLEGSVRRRKRRDLVDRIAAVLILQGYLDLQRSGAPREEEE